MTIIHRFGVALTFLFGATFAQSVNNLALGEGVVYGSAAADGVVVLEPSASVVATLPVPKGIGAVHDVAFADGFLFVLDAIGGVLGIYDSSTPSAPIFVNNSTRDVDVGPFAGISAAGGFVSVSGGTGSMFVFSYDTSGSLALVTDSLTLGIGQPDVLVSPTTGFAYVSTDFNGLVDGESFGISVVDLSSPTAATSQIGLPGAGFTGGVSSPANFPIESALIGDRLLVAHGGGLSILSIVNASNPTLMTTIPLPFPAVNVDATNRKVVVVGGTTTPMAAEVDLRDNSVAELSLPERTGAGTATGVAVLGDSVIVAAGDVLAATTSETMSVASVTPSADPSVVGKPTNTSSARPSMFSLPITTPKSANRRFLLGKRSLFKKFGYYKL